MFNNIYSKKRVLITGYSGFKGSWLCYWLNQLGAELYGYSLPMEGENHLSLLNVKGDFKEGDINDLNNLKTYINKVKPEIVFHLAAQPIVRESYRNPLDTFQTNIIGTANVLESCRGIDELKAIVMITSDKCYENSETLSAYQESDPLGGYDPYSASKGCAELIIASYRQSFFSLDNYKNGHNTLLASARAGNVIGGGDWSMDRLIPDLIRSRNKGAEVTIRCPDAIRPWQHVLECVSSYLLLGQNLLEGHVNCAEAWNFGPDVNEHCSVGELVKLAKQYWPDIAFELGENTGVHEANYLKLNCQKARTKLRCLPVWTLETTIAQTMKWYKAYYSNDLIHTESDLAAFIYDARQKQLIWTN